MSHTHILPKALIFSGVLNIISNLKEKQPQHPKGPQAITAEGTTVACSKQLPSQTLRWSTFSIQLKRWYWLFDHF